MANDVVIGFRTENLEQTRAAIESFYRVVDQANGGSSGTPRSGRSLLPSGAPAGTPTPSTGLDTYNSSPGISSPPPVAALTGFSGSGAPPTAPPAAPNPYAQSPGTTTVHAQNVTVVAGGGGGGGYGGVPPAPPAPGNGGYGGYGGGYGPVGAGPFGNWNPWGGGGQGQVPPWLSRLINSSPSYGMPGMAGFMAYPGAVRMMGAAGMGMGLGLGTGSYALNYAYTGQQHQYQTETDIMAMQMGGHWINPAISAAMSQSSVLQDQLSQGQMLAGTIGGVIGGIAGGLGAGPLGAFGGAAAGGTAANAFYMTTIGQSLQRQIALTQARGQSTATLNSINALVGGGYRPGSDAESQQFLDARLALAQQASFFGRGGSGGTLGVDFTRYTSRGFDLPSVVGAFGSVIGAGRIAGNTSIFDNLNGHGSPEAVKGMAASYYAGVGDIDRLSSMQPIFSRPDYDKYMTAVQGVFLSKSRQAAADANTGYLSSAASVISYGGSSGSVSRALGAVTASMAPSLAEAQNQYQAALTSGNQIAINQARSQVESIRNSMSSARRGQESYDYGIDIGQIGIGGASADTAAMQAQMFGGPSAIRAAGLRSSNVVLSQAGAVQGQLNRTDLTSDERIGFEREEIDLRRQLNQMLTQNLRNFADLNLSLATARVGIAQTISSGAMQYLGVGGSGAQGYVQTNEAAAVKQYQDAVAKLNVLKSQHVDPNNSEYVQAQAAVASARNQAQGVNDSLASVPFSASSRDAMLKGQTELNVLQNTYAGWGDIRGTTAGLLKETGQQMRELNKNRAQIGAQVDAEIRNGITNAADRNSRIQELNLQYDQQQSGLVNQAVGYQNQLQNGWMDRLVSMSVNMPGRGALVASQFTQREAAPFLGAMTGAFGFSGANGQSDRDSWLHRGDRIATGTFGDVTMPEGFINTAMAMAGRSGTGTSAGGSSSGAGEVVRIAIDPIKVVVVDQTGKEVGRGGSAGPLHVLYQGGNAQVQSAHASGVSRQ